MFLADLSEHLKGAQSELNFFDHAYRELSHEAVLDYCFEAFRRGDTWRATSPGQFGREILGRCFPDLDGPPLPDEVQIERQRSLSTENRLRPDFLFTVERDGRTYGAVLETKLGAPADGKQLNSYQAFLEENEFASFHIALYKSTYYYGTIEDPSVTLLTPREIYECLGVATENGSSEWIIDEYRRWIGKTVWRDKLLAHNEFHDWYFGVGDAVPDGVSQEDIEKCWPKRGNWRRRVHWHLLRNVALKLPGVDEGVVRTCLVSRGNANSNTAWVQLRAAHVKSGFMFYRIDRRTHGRVLDFCLYAGPKQGSPPSDEKRKWVTIKKALRESLRNTLRTCELDEGVHTPGRQEYSFQRKAKETSMCRIWLPSHDHPPPDGQGVAPSAIYDLFPRLHGAIVEAVLDVPDLASRVEEWTLPTIQ